MKNSKNILKGLLITVSSLIAGFLALALPFKLLTELTPRDTHVLFILELAVYFTTAIIFLCYKDRKKAEKVKEEERRFQRRAKFEQAQREYYDLAA